VLRLADWFRLPVLVAKKSLWELLLRPFKITSFFYILNQAKLSSIYYILSYLTNFVKIKASSLIYINKSIFFFDFLRIAHYIYKIKKGILPATRRIPSSSKIVLINRGIFTTFLFFFTIIFFYDHKTLPSSLFHLLTTLFLKILLI